MSKFITIISKLDNITIQTDELAAKGSILLTNLIAEYEENVFVIPEIKGEILRLIVEFLEYTKDNPCSELPKPIPHFDLKDMLSEWEYDFLSRFDDNVSELFELINAVNYLDVRGLFELSCAKAASIIKDYNQEQFMAVFQIEPDLNEEEYKNLVNKFQINFEQEIDKNIIEKENNIDIDIDLNKRPQNSDQI